MNIVGRNKFFTGRIKHSIVPFLMALTILITSACLGTASPPTPNGSRTVTPTPTPVIMAQEQTTTPEAGGAIWRGLITSDTWREYYSNGKLLNKCVTDWDTDLTMIVDSSGHVTGDATGKLALPRTCTAAKNLVPNVTAWTFKIDGTKTDKEFTIRFVSGSASPGPPAGEFGGYSLLFHEAACTGKPRDILIPITNPKTAVGDFQIGEVMQGCGGSKDDFMGFIGGVKVSYSFDCNDRPSNLNDPEINKLCQK